MSLRTRMVLAVVGAMSIVAMLLGLTVAADHYARSQAERARAARVAAAVLEAVGDAVRFGQIMKEATITSWAIISDDGGLRAWSEGAIVPGLGKEEALARVRPNTPSIRVPGNGHLHLRVEEGPGFVSGLSSGAIALAVGTVLMVVVACMLLAALVARPIERLVQATRVLSAGGRPQKVVGEERRDEIGELIRSFNRMADEVRSSREDLEKKVEEATRDYQKAQKRLVLEQRLASTGRLAAGVAHEINNPLGGMLNAARSIEQDPQKSPRSREYASLIVDGLERISRTVSRMLQFHRHRPEVKPVNISAVLKEALAFCEHRLKKETIELVLDAPESLMVQGDSGELQQAFLNLFMNSLDAVRDTPEKKLQVRASRDGEEVLVTVADNGKGMTEEELEHAFDLFFTAKDEEGTGLGLAIVHTIIVDHGGRVELHSELGSGTRATVILPAEAEA